MPLYEYRCHNCRRRVTVFVRTSTQGTTPVCEHCGRGWSHVAVTTAKAVADPTGTACPNCGAAQLADFPAATADQLAAAGLTKKDYA